MTKQRRHDENYDVATRVFPWIDEPVQCLAQSQDLHWCFFAMDVAESPCDWIRECFQCWPLCAYCWYVCDLDGYCDQEECLTNEPWARKKTSSIHGPPWFEQAYTELYEAIITTPWRPKTIWWRTPKRKTAQDSVLYYPEVLEAYRVSSIEAVWRNMFVLTVKKPAKRAAYEKIS